MKKLFTVTFGSHLYGTNTPESDMDYKVVFLPDIKDLILNKKIGNITQNTSGANQKNTKDDVDIEYIPLHKFVRDFYQGQTYALELAFAVKSGYKVEINYEDADFIVRTVDQLVSGFLTNRVDSMIGYAMSQSYKYGIKGRRYDALSKLRDELSIHVYQHTDIEDRNSPVNKAYCRITQNDYIRVENGDLLVLDKVYQGNTHVFEVQDRVKAMLDKFGDRTKVTNVNGNIDWKSVSHAVRISMMVVDLLKNGKLEFPLPKYQIDLALSIKGGLVPWLDVEKLILDTQDEIEEAKKGSALPNASEELRLKLEDWLFDKLSTMYSIYGECNVLI